MSQRILDEREHRRGLVLGLTLAEVLILLLFMLLLALGARLNKLEQDKKRADIVLTEIGRHLPEDAGESGSVKTRELVAKLNWIIRLERQYPAIDGKLDAIDSVVEAAVKINPDDPPAALRVAQDVLEKLGPSAGSARLAALEGIVTELERNFAAAGTGAAKPSGHGSNTPPTLIERTLVILEKAGSVLKPKPTTGAEKGKGKHDWPPIITLSEGRGYTFASGSVEVSPDFQAKLLTTAVKDLLDRIEEYGADDIDVVEVIGHTDEQPFTIRMPRPDPIPDGPVTTPSPLPKRYPRLSNLDTTLIQFLNGQGELGRLVASDNAGLGLARAASVVRVLMKDERLKRFRLLPLSGGQLIEVGDKLTLGSPGSVSERRRIEIRARRSDKSVQAWQGKVTQDAPLPSPK